MAAAVDDSHPGRIVVDLAVSVTQVSTYQSVPPALRRRDLWCGELQCNGPRLVGTLAEDVDAVEVTVPRARRAARRRIRGLAGENSPKAGISAACRWRSTSAPCS